MWSRWSWCWAYVELVSRGNPGVIFLILGRINHVVSMYVRPFCHVCMQLCVSVTVQSICVLIVVLSGVCVVVVVFVYCIGNCINNYITSNFLSF